MRWLLVFLLALPSIARAERTAAESEALARDEAAPRLDLLCGMHLRVHYDLQSLGKDDVEDTCEEPLRFFYYACQKEEARRTIQLAHPESYECRGGTPGHGKLTVEHGKITLYVDPNDSDMRALLEDLAGGLHTGVARSYIDSSAKTSFHGHDKKWEAFIAAPIATATDSDFCMVDGKKIPLPPTGDPLAPPHVRVRCVHGGKLVTEMSADGTGFVTKLDGTETHFDSYKQGRPDGESWVRHNGLFAKRVFTVDGRVAWSEDYFRNGKLRMHTNTVGTTGGEIVFDPDENVAQLECGEGSANDPVLRSWCGFDQPRKVFIKQPGNERTVLMTNGLAKIVE